MVDRRRRHAGLDQLDPPAVHDLVVGRGRDGHGPAEVMGDAETHATDCASTVLSSVWRLPGCTERLHRLDVPCAGAPEGAIDVTRMSVRAHRRSAPLFAHADRRTWQRRAQNGLPAPISVPAMVSRGAYCQ